MTDSPLFTEGSHEDIAANKEAWVYIEIIKTACADAVKAADLGLIDPDTLEPIEQRRPIISDMLDLIHGAEWIKTKTCRDLCGYIARWSEGKIRLEPSRLIALVKAEIARRKPKPKNKKYGTTRQ